MKSTRVNETMPPIPQPADKLLAELEAGLKAIAPDWIDGIYVTGSIALDDFHPHKSDIDFVVLCKEFPTNEMIAQIDKLHRTIQQQHGKPLFNGAYLTAENLQASRLPTGEVLNLLEGNLKRGPFEMGPIALYELKTTARTVLGLPTNELAIDMPLQQVKDFMHENINSYWQRWIDKHASCTNRRALLILIPLLTEWAVLGVARQFYTLQTGEIASKTKAGAFCLDVVPPRYQDIIQQAIHIRNSSPNSVYPVLKRTYYVSPSLTRAALTIDCVNYIIELFNNVYADQQKQRTGEGLSDKR
ncbi:aminoglycoside adenylyltransferase domain-containing protein [Spirosoma validum]|uniref:DUF4111 domain-containing protein n=1 Tax=Spirosoma validum TaxID=2771355 RepID=A0A927B5E6_9BACT|nr:aminoglycoside adenylyltransferase domain-containing protein [Spirosoma validum]MBD2755760.1 DUF4111 domain-containing protein [Spirosoma validum]